MRMTGHKTRSIFDRYHIVSPNDLQEAAVKLAMVTDSIIEKAAPEQPNSVAETVPETAIAGSPKGAKSAKSTQRVFGRTLRKTANPAIAASR
jgi:hypothetical protein